MEDDGVWTEILAAENKLKVMNKLKERKFEVEEWPSPKEGVRDAALALISGCGQL